MSVKYGYLKDKKENKLLPRSFKNYNTPEDEAIGEWIDGKPIYRKVYTFTEVLSPSVYPLNISIDKVISLTVMVWQKDVNSFRPVPWLYTESIRTSNPEWSGGVYISNNQLIFQVGTALGNIRYGHAIIEYTKKED